MNSLTNGTTTSKHASNAHRPIFKWSDGAIAKPKRTRFVSSRAGKTQLVICVAGIYVSLYVLSDQLQNVEAHDIA